MEKKKVETLSLTVHISAKQAISCRRKGENNCEKEEKNMKKQTNKLTHSQKKQKKLRTKNAKLLFFIGKCAITSLV